MAQDVSERTCQDVVADTPENGNVADVIGWGVVGPQTCR
jgi:hypothetical protein